MFAGFFSKIGLYLILGVVLLLIGVGGYAVYENQKVQIANLTASVSTLTTSNQAQGLQITHLVDDMAVVKQAQMTAQAAIDKATQTSMLSQQKIRSQNLNKAAIANSTALQLQINAAMTSTLQSWGNISK
jgi:cell division protein FtsB